MLFTGDTRPDVNRRSIAVESVMADADMKRILTSAGISAGIDMALRVVIRYFGEAVGRGTARNMEYPFPDNNQRRV